MAKATVLALDVEGTLISNAMSQIPRPGLASFLESCRQMFKRVVVFTTVREDRFRAIAKVLVEEGSAPEWFLDIEYVAWTGARKDLHFVPGASPDQILLVDDYEGYVVPEQRSQWVAAPLFEHPYPDADDGLAKVMEELQRRLE